MSDLRGTFDPLGLPIHLPEFRDVEHSERGDTFGARGSVVYFLQADYGGPVKIGSSTASGVKARVKSLQTGTPYRLVVRRVVQGDVRSLEGDFHRSLASYRVRGEWFYPSRCIRHLARCVSGTHDAAFDVALSRGYEVGFEEGRAFGRSEAVANVAELVGMLDGPRRVTVNLGRGIAW